MKLLAMDAALALAMQHWQVGGTIKPLPSYADQNFLIRSDTGEFVLKLANPGWSHTDLDLENQAMMQLARAEPAYAWPSVLPAVDGTHILSVDIGGETRQVRLLTYVPGRTYADAIAGLPTVQRPALQSSLGRAVACMNQGLAALRHPAAGRAQEWNLMNLPALLGEIDHIADLPLRAIVQRRATAFCAALPLLAARLPLCVLHNDANDLNVIVGEQAEVTAVIDFGDMCTGFRLAELAVACTYAMQHEEDPVDCARHMLRGYLARAELLAEERELLHAFIVARLCHSILMATRALRRQPDNPHILVSQDGVRALLRKLDALPAEERVPAPMETLSD